MVGSGGWAGAGAPSKEYSERFILCLRDVMASLGGLTGSTCGAVDFLESDFEGPSFDPRKLSKRGLSGPMSVVTDGFLVLGVFFGFVSLPALFAVEFNLSLPCTFPDGTRTSAPLTIAARTSSESLCSFSRLAADANPACAPAGTCCALDPLFNGCARDRTKALGERSCEEERVVEVVLTLRRRLSGVIEGAW